MDTKWVGSGYRTHSMAKYKPYDLNQTKMAMAEGYCGKARPGLVGIKQAV
jgi:hypothetical protein